MTNYLPEGSFFMGIDYKVCKHITLITENGFYWLYLAKLVHLKMKVPV